MLVLHYHPFSRASNVVWMLEEVGAPYELRFVDFIAGANKSPEFIGINPMGKLPVLQDDDVVITESAAIGLYLADRYAAGRLAPALDDAARGTYFRWSLFAPSVVEPGLQAKVAGWDFKESQAGWGNYESMLTAMERAISPSGFLLPSGFSMADMIFGGLVRFLLSFKILEPRPTFVAYADLLGQRPALKRAEARNAAVVAERGLGQ